MMITPDLTVLLYPIEFDESLDSPSPTWVSSSFKLHKDFAAEVELPISNCGNGHMTQHYNKRRRVEEPNDKSLVTATSAISATDNNTKVPHEATVKCTHELTGHTDTILCLLYRESTDTLYSGSKDSTIKVLLPFVLFVIKLR